MPKIGAYGNLFQDHRTSDAAGRIITQKRLEDGSEASLKFEPNAGNCRRFGGANHNRHSIAVTAEWLEAKRVYLGAPEAKGRHDMQTEEMPTVWPERAARPAARLEHFHNLQVAG